MKGIPVLMYHVISDDLHAYEFSAEEAVYVVEYDHFLRQMYFLSEQNFNVLTLRELISLKTNGAKLPRKPVIITFDDGHESNFTTAYPVLKKLNFKAEIFITTSNIGKKGYLSEEQIVAMHRNGFSIQSHLVDHIFLTDIKERRKQEYQLLKSRETLNSLLNDVIEFVSLPGGRLNNSIARLVEMCGYRGLCTSIPGFNIPFAPYAIRRVAIRNFYTFEDYKKIINVDRSFYLMLKAKYELLRIPKVALGNKIYLGMRKRMLERLSFRQ